MDVSISRGCLDDFDACLEALTDSDLGREYFFDSENAVNTIKEGLGSEHFYVARVNDQVVGFIWFILDGAFHCFPYLHIIAVSKKYRGSGIGAQLLNFYEDIAFKHADKIFLVTGDFNPRALQLYKRIGYKEVSPIPDLYKKGVTEFLLIKTKNS